MKNFFKLDYLILAVLILTALSPLHTGAQTFTSFSALGMNERLEVELTPEIPGPHEDVDVFVNSYTFDINKSEISWYLNGTLIDSDIGLTNFSFKTRGMGERTTLRIVVNKQDGYVVEETFNIIPAEIDVMVEPNTYTPPFYKGGAVPTYQTDIKLVAIPNFVDENGNKIPDSEIVYKWEVDGGVDQSQSGTRRNVYVHETDIISRPLEVYLTASPINSDQVASVYRVIDYTQPQIRIYEDNPVFGTIFGNSIDNNFLLSRQEIKFNAVPLFFDKGVIGNNYKWTVNGDTLSNQKGPSITFRRVDDKPGTARISVRVRNEEDKILQAGNASFSLTFNEGGENFEF